MANKKYRIRLTADEQRELKALVSRGRTAAYKQTHARILLMSDESRRDGGMKDMDITSALGVGVSMNEQVDESPAGSLLEGIIEVIDEFYSANLSQDTIRGMKENAARGFRNGGSVPFGYTREVLHVAGVPKSTLALDEKEIPIVARAFELASLGKGAKEVARILNAEGSKTRTRKSFSATGINHILIPIRHDCAIILQM